MALDRNEDSASRKQKAEELQELINDMIKDSNAVATKKFGTGSPECKKIAQDLEVANRWIAIKTMKGYQLYYEYSEISERVILQIIGRVGRQVDPGFAQAVLSLDKHSADLGSDLRTILEAGFLKRGTVAQQKRYSDILKRVDEFQELTKKLDNAMGMVIGDPQCGQLQSRLEEAMDQLRRDKRLLKYGKATTTGDYEPLTEEEKAEILKRRDGALIAFIDNCKAAGLNVYGSSLAGIWKLRNEISDEEEAFDGIFREALDQLEDRASEDSFKKSELEKKAAECRGRLAAECRLIMDDVQSGKPEGIGKAKAMVLAICSSLFEKYTQGKEDEPKKLETLRKHLLATLGIDCKGQSFDQIRDRLKDGKFFDKTPEVMDIKKLKAALDELQIEFLAQQMELQKTIGEDVGKVAANYDAFKENLQEKIVATYCSLATKEKTKKSKVDEAQARKEENSQAEKRKRALDDIKLKQVQDKQKESQGRQARGQLLQKGLGDGAFAFARNWLVYQWGASATRWLMAKMGMVEQLSDSDQDRNVAVAKKVDEWLAHEWIDSATRSILMGAGERAERYAVERAQKAQDVGNWQLWHRSVSAAWRFVAKIGTLARGSELVNVLIAPKTESQKQEDTKATQAPVQPPQQKETPHRQEVQEVKSAAETEETKPETPKVKLVLGTTEGERLAHVEGAFQTGQNGVATVIVRLEKGVSLNEATLAAATQLIAPPGPDGKPAVIVKLQPAETIHLQIMPYVPDDKDKAKATPLLDIHLSKDDLTQVLSQPEQVMKTIAGPETYLAIGGNSFVVLRNENGSAHELHDVGSVSDEELIAFLKSPAALRGKPDPALKANPYAQALGDSPVQIINGVITDRDSEYNTKTTPRGVVVMASVLNNRVALAPGARVLGGVIQAGSVGNAFVLNVESSMAKIADRAKARHIKAESMEMEEGSEATDIGRRVFVKGAVPKGDTTPVNRLVMGKNTRAKSINATEVVLEENATADEAQADGSVTLKKNAHLDHARSDGSLVCLEDSRGTNLHAKGSITLEEDAVAMNSSNALGSITVKGNVKDGNGEVTTEAGSLHYLDIDKDNKIPGGNITVAAGVVTVGIPLADGKNAFGQPKSMAITELPKTEDIWLERDPEGWLDQHIRAGKKWAMVLKQMNIRGLKRALGLNDPFALMMREAQAKSPREKTWVKILKGINTVLDFFDSSDTSVDAIRNVVERVRKQVATPPTGFRQSRLADHVDAALAHKDGDTPDVLKARLKDLLTNDHGVPPALLDEVIGHILDAQRQGAPLERKAVAEKLIRAAEEKLKSGALEAARTLLALALQFNPERAKGYELLAIVTEKLADSPDYANRLDITKLSAVELREALLMAMEKEKEEKDLNAEAKKALDAQVARIIRNKANIHNCRDLERYARMLPKTINALAAFGVHTPDETAEALTAEIKDYREEILKTLKEENAWSDVQKEVLEAITLSKLGRHEEAKAKAESYYLTSKDPELQLVLVQAMIAEGKVAEALALWETVMKDLGDHALPNERLVLADLRLRAYQDVSGAEKLEDPKEQKKQAGAIEAKRKLVREAYQAVLSKDESHIKAQEALLGLRLDEAQEKDEIFTLNQGGEKVSVSETAEEFVQRTWPKWPKTAQNTKIAQLLARNFVGLSAEGVDKTRGVLKDVGEKMSTRQQLEKKSLAEFYAIFFQDKETPDGVERIPRFAKNEDRAFAIAQMAYQWGMKVAQVEQLVAIAEKIHGANPGQGKPKPEIANRELHKFGKDLPAGLLLDQLDREKDPAELEILARYNSEKDPTKKQELLRTLFGSVADEDPALTSALVSIMELDLPPDRKLATLEAAVQRDAQKTPLAKRFSRRMLERVQKGDYPAALIRAEQVLQKDPKHPEARLWLPILQYLSELGKENISDAERKGATERLGKEMKDSLQILPPDSLTMGLLQQVYGKFMAEARTGLQKAKENATKAAKDAQSARTSWAKASRVAKQIKAAETNLQKATGQNAKRLKAAIEKKRVAFKALTEKAQRADEIVAGARHALQEAEELLSSAKKSLAAGLKQHYPESYKVILALLDRPDISPVVHQITLNSLEQAANEHSVTATILTILDDKDTNLEKKANALMAMKEGRERIFEDVPIQLLYETLGRTQGMAREQLAILLVALARTMASSRHAVEEQIEIATNVISRKEIPHGNIVKFVDVNSLVDNPQTGNILAQGPIVVFSSEGAISQEMQRKIQAQAALGVEISFRWIADANQFQTVYGAVAKKVKGNPRLVLITTPENFKVMAAWAAQMDADFKKNIIVMIIDSHSDVVVLGSQQIDRLRTLLGPQILYELGLQGMGQPKRELRLLPEIWSNTAAIEDILKSRQEAASKA